MSGQTYEVGVHLSAVNGISGVLAVIAKDVLGLNGSVKELEKGFKGLKLGILGAATAAAGAGLLEVASRFEKAGEKLVHAQVGLAAALPKTVRAFDMQIAKTAALNEIGKNWNTTLSGNIERLHDLYNVVQNVGHAAKVLHSFNNLATAVAITSGKPADEKNLMSMARAIELTGRTTPAQINQTTEDMIPAVIGLRGRVDGSTLQNVVQTSGGGRYSWSEQFFTQDLPALVNIMKARAGMALYNAFNNLYGGVSSSLAQAQYQIKYGLHSANDELWGPYHRFMGFKVGSMWHAQEYGANPVQWANDYRTRLKGMGVDTDNMSQMQKLVISISRGNRGMQSLLDELLLPNSNRQINKEVGNIRNVGSDTLNVIKDKDPAYWRTALGDQWKSLEEQIGKTLVPYLINDVLKPLTKALATINQVGGKDPDLFKAIGIGIAGLGVVLSGAGGAMIIAAIGPVGWIGLGIAGIVAAMRYFDPQSFKMFETFFESLPSMLMIGFKAIETAFDGFLSFMRGIPGEILSWFKGSGNAMNWDGPLQKESYHPGGSLLNNGVMYGAGGSSAPWAIPNDGSLYSRIIGAEGTAKHGDPYNASLGYLSSPMPLTSMTNDEALEWGRHIRSVMGMNSSAKGAFQIENSTQRAAMTALGLKGNALFTPAEQREMADWIYRHQGYEAWQGFERHPNLIPRVTIHHTTTLDGKVIARSTDKHLAKNYTHPKRAPYPDGKGMYRAPDAQLVST